MRMAVTGEHLRFKERFEQLCATRVAPNSEWVDESMTFSPESWAALSAVDELSYFRLFHPASIGGSEADGLKIAIAMEALAKACPSTYMMATVTAALAGKVLVGFGKTERHRVWRDDMLRGKLIGCLAYTESNGSDPASHTTELRRTRKGYVVSGAKSRIGNAPVADVCVLFCVVRDGERRGLAVVLLDPRSAGISITPVEPLGLRGLSWGNIELDDVVVHEDDVVVLAMGEDKYMEFALASVEWGQLMQSCCAVGNASAALEEASRWVRERRLHGRPMGELQRVHSLIAECYVAVDAARTLVWEAVAAKVDGRGNASAVARQIMMSKIYSTEMAVDVATTAMRLMGGWGFVRSSQNRVQRILRDSLAGVPSGLPTDLLRELLVAPDLAVAQVPSGGDLGWVHDHQIDMGGKV